MIAGLALRVTNGRESIEGEELVLSIKDDQKTQYLNQNFETSKYIEIRVKSTHKPTII